MIDRAFAQKWTTGWERTVWGARIIKLRLFGLASQGRGRAEMLTAMWVAAALDCEQITTCEIFFVHAPNPNLLIIIFAEPVSQMGG
jgi:hypothetical protein